MTAESSSAVEPSAVLYIGNPRPKAQDQLLGLVRTGSLARTRLTIAVEDQVKITHIMTTVFFHIVGHSLQDIGAVIVNIQPPAAGPTSQMYMGCRVGIIAANAFAGIKTAYKT